MKYIKFLIFFKKTVKYFFFCIFWIKSQKIRKWKILENLNSRTEINSNL